MSSAARPASATSTSTTPWRRQFSPPVYVFARRDTEAMATFKTAMPVLLQAARDTEDDTTGNVAYYSRLSNVIEAYLTLLARTPDAGGAHAAESFQLRDLIGGRSVQRALEASSARAVAGNPALAALVRKEQDLEKQIARALDNLNTMLALAPEERDADSDARPHAEIDKAQGRARRGAARHRAEVPGLCRPGDAARRHRPRTSAPCSGPTRRSCRSISAAAAASSGPCPSSGPIAFHGGAPIVAPVRRADSQAARGARAAGRDDRRHSAVRRRGRLRALR